MYNQTDFRATVRRTIRGFEFVEFNDMYGENCTLQQSSVIYDYPDAMERPGTSAIWLGIDEPQPKILVRDAIALGLTPPEGTTVGWMNYRLPEEVTFASRMHLSREQVCHLIGQLQTWLTYGSFEPELEKEPLYVLLCHPNNYSGLLEAIEWGLFEMEGRIGKDYIVQPNVIIPELRHTGRYILPDGSCKSENVFSLREQFVTYTKADIDYLLYARVIEKEMHRPVVSLRYRAADILQQRRVFRSLVDEDWRFDCPPKTVTN